jgi:hypothetical protein
MAGASDGARARERGAVWESKSSGVQGEDPVNLRDPESAAATGNDDEGTAANATNAKKPGVAMPPAGEAIISDDTHRKICHSVSRLQSPQGTAGASSAATRASYFSCISRQERG